MTDLNALRAAVEEKRETARLTDGVYVSGHGRNFYFEESELAAYRATVVKLTRAEFAAEARTRLVATDPVGLKTGPLYDWLTKEMGE